jgi:hypothetical protein
MPLMKATWFARYKTFGYSWSLYKDVLNLSAMLVPAKDLRTAWGQLLGMDVELPYFRVSEESVKRDSLYQETPAITVGPGSAPAPTTWNQIKSAMNSLPDYGGTALLIDFIVSASAKGRFFLRLIPDDIVRYPDGFVQDPGWEKAFKTFSKVLAIDSWMVKTAASTAVNPQLPIRFLQWQPLTMTLEVETFGNHNLNVSDTVRIGQTKGSTGVNGTYFIYAITDATHFRVILSSAPTLGNQPSGYARKISPAYQGIAEARVKGVTGRKPGRPFGSSVGRRPVRP